MINVYYRNEDRSLGKATVSGVEDIDDALITAHMLLLDAGCSIDPPILAVVPKQINTMQ